MRRSTSCIYDQHIGDVKYLEHIENAAKSELARDLIERIELGTYYMLCVNKYETEGFILDRKMLVYTYELTETTFRDIEIAHVVYVEEPHVRHINCHNCGAPLNVGKLTNGQALVLCEYCHTNHIVKA